jgi:enoyl-CoA hydratase/carnithine racemase
VTNKSSVSVSVSVIDLPFFSNPDIQVMVTSGKGKFFSNGLDLHFLTRKLNSSDGEDFQKEWGTRIGRLISRLMEFPMVTVAALNGNCVRLG